ncbi:collagen-like protein [Patiriisocius hiemis]|uniref:Collagen-like protein n=1 Tax=Patiriisocius hiemis TaxID=3075604 RepID=A0ABU2Y9W4_9FLAO|nr:collagen-like protein [Constantimarinum sp. W242]MDT0554978.1 collagen-like protein [Constantimarinum sp. W242]
MKKIFILFTIAATTLFTSCTDETIIEENFFLAQTFEVTTTLFFNSNTNIYETDFISIPSNIEVFESDAILAYRLEAVANGNDVWSQLPQNFFLSNGDIIQYVFNHTFFDVQVQLDGQYDPNTLPVDFTDNQTFRFVVVPSEFANANMTMEQAIETFNLQY